MKRTWEFPGALTLTGEGIWIHTDGLLIASKSHPYRGWQPSTASRLSLLAEPWVFLIYMQSCYYYHCTIYNGMNDVGTSCCSGKYQFKQLNHHLQLELLTEINFHKPDFQESILFIKTCSLFFISLGSFFSHFTGLKVEHGSFADRAAVSHPCRQQPSRMFGWDQHE
jgi:hypothetical protein